MYCFATMPEIGGAYTEKRNLAHSKVTREILGASWKSLSPIVPSRVIIFTASIIFIRFVKCEMSLLWKPAAKLCRSTRQVVGRCFWNLIKLVIHGHVSNTNFFDRFAQMLFSRYQKRGFSPFFIEIHVDLLRYVPCDAHWKGQIPRFMQMWCAFELRTVFAMSLDDIR